MTITYKEIETIPEFIDAIRIRVDVFIKEQGFAPGWEPDADDKTARQFIAVLGNEIIATARVRELSPRAFKIERMAVKKENRNAGIGKELMLHMLSELMKQKPASIWLNSQLHASAFYEKLGFQAVGAPFDQYGVMHVRMEHKGNI